MGITSLGHILKKSEKVRVYTMNKFGVKADKNNQNTFHRRNTKKNMKERGKTKSSIRIITS